MGTVEFAVPLLVCCDTELCSTNYLLLAGLPPEQQGLGRVRGRTSETCRLPAAQQFDRGLSIFLLQSMHDLRESGRLVPVKKHR